MLGIAEMAEALDLGRSTTHRYASTLVALGYLEQRPSPKYRLASRAEDVALALFYSMLPRKVAHKHLRELRNQTGWTVNVGVLIGTDVIYIARWHGSRRGQYMTDANVGLGTRHPAHCTAAGKAILAALPSAERLARTVELKLKRYTHNTIKTKAGLRSELDLIATNGGLAIENEELIIGRCALAIAVAVDEEERAFAAVQLAIPSHAYTGGDELVEHLGSKLAATARGIASALA